MPARVTFDIVRRLGLGIPGVEESTAYGVPALKVGGKLLACIPTHKSAEPDSLVVRVDLETREELIAAAPDIYYIKDHYKSYTGVLVRLNRIEPDALRDLLGGAFRFVTHQKKSNRRRA